MEKDKDILKELNELAPNLSKLPKKGKGKVPFNYFETLPEKVFDKIRKEEEAKSSKWMTWLRSLWAPKLIPAYAMAAIVGLGIFWFAEQGNEHCDLDCEFAQIDEAALSDYIFANLDDFNDHMIETNYLPSGNEELLYLDTDDETIENYLLDEMSDLEYEGVIL